MQSDKPLNQLSSFARYSPHGIYSRKTYKGMEKRGEASSMGIEELSCPNCGELKDLEYHGVCKGCFGLMKDTSDSVEHPGHYGGKDNVYEAIKVIEAWSLGFCLGNTVKYISRAGKKDPEKLLEDLRKARWYLDREIKGLEDEVDL